MKVSIIIPVYEVSAYIEHCVRSVMNQTYNNIECIIVDDATKDDSILKCKRLISDYKGSIMFLIFHHGQNRGLSAARNTGLDAAKGDFVFFLYGDDVISADCIETLMGMVKEYRNVEMVRATDINILFMAILLYSEKNCSPLAATNEEVRRCYYQYRQMGVGVWNKLYRRDFLLRNNLRCQEGLIYEDTLWTFDLLKCLNCACFVLDITYHYKQRPHSILTGTRNEEKAENFGKIYRYILMHLTHGHEREEFGYYAKKYSVIFAKFSRFSSEYKDVLQMWREKAKVYGCLGIRLRLALCQVWGKFRYGWLSILTCAHKNWRTTMTPWNGT